MRSPTTPQLDLFADSGNVVLRNAVVDALVARQRPALLAARAALAEADPQHGWLPALDLLLVALPPADAPRFADAAALGLALQQLRQQLIPAAEQVLGRAAATAWLRPFWAGLAQRAARLPLEAGQAGQHAAALWLQAADPAAAAEAVATIPSWWRMPQPLAWMVRARFASQGLDAVWPLLAELAWLSPARFMAEAQALADPLLARLLRAFDAGFEPEAGAAEAPAAWFPAWVVNEKPGLLPQLRQARPGLDSAAEQGFWLVAELLGLERQGRHTDLVERRKRLRDLHPGLYAGYLRSR